MIDALPLRVIALFRERLAVFNCERKPSPVNFRELRVLIKTDIDRHGLLVPLP